jgi:peptidyl-prolyl cis-trans isomerase D
METVYELRTPSLKQERHMLQQMREAQGWLIKGVLWAVVLAFVVTIFYSWGVQSSSQAPTRSEVATILGHRVSLAEFQRVQNILYQTYRNIFRNRTDIDLREQFNFREMALERIAHQHILLDIARQERLQVTKDELYQHIAAFPAFQHEGRFDPTRYRALLQNQVPPISPHQFENEQSQTILSQKVYDLIQAGVQVTEAEAQVAYQREHEQVAVQYVTLDPSLFSADVIVTEEEEQAHYEAHKGTYRRPEQRQFRYVTVSPQRFPFTGDIPQEDIAAYYETHASEFSREEQVRVRHILLKVPTHADTAQETEIRTRATDLLTALRDGGDFAALATKHSEDEATAKQGGDLGYFPRGQMVPAFENVAFTLPVGQVSDLVRTDFGFHILRVEDKLEAGVKTLDEVQESIRTTLRQQKAQDAALTFVDDLMILLEEEAGRFVALAEQHNLPIITTSFVTQNGRIENLEGVPEFLTKAFALRELAVDTVTGPDGTHYLFQVAGTRPSTIPPFADVKDRVTADLRRHKSAELARQTADAWGTKIQTGTTLAALAEPLKVDVIKTALFKRNDVIPQFGRSAAFSRIAFGLQPNEAGVAHEGPRHAVIQLLERQAADMHKYATEKQAYMRQLRQRKQQQQQAAFENFLRARYQQLRQEGGILVNPQYVF